MKQQHVKKVNNNIAWNVAAFSYSHWSFFTDKSKPDQQSSVSISMFVQWLSLRFPGHSTFFSDSKNLEVWDLCLWPQVLLFTWILHAKIRPYYIEQKTSTCSSHTHSKLLPSNAGSPIENLLELLQQNFYRLDGLAQ